MIWHIPEAKVLSSGDVRDFLYEEYQVQWFDIELGAQPLEEHFRLVNLEVDSTSAHPSALFLRQREEDAGVLTCFIAYQRCVEACASERLHPTRLGWTLEERLRCAEECRQALDACNRGMLRGFDLAVV
jgi:hypothetical protein